MSATVPHVLRALRTGAADGTGRSGGLDLRLQLRNRTLGEVDPLVGQGGTDEPLVAHQALGVDKHLTSAHVGVADVDTKRASVTPEPEGVGKQRTCHLHCGILRGTEVRGRGRRRASDDGEGERNLLLLRRHTLWADEERALTPVELYEGRAGVAAEPTRRLDLAHCRTSGRRGR